MAIAQRSQQQDAQRIARLGQHRHHADRADAGVKLLADDVQHRLAVVDRRDAESGTGGQSKHQRRRERFILSLGLYG